MDNDKKNDFDAPLVDHEYDGIQELNNPAPFWWQLFFYISIAFGIAYYLYYEVAGGPSMDEEFNSKLTTVQQIQQQNKTSGPSDDEWASMIKDSKIKSEGKEIFLKNCASCHAADGGGTIGPNLTDDYWIHGKGNINDIFSVINKGVLDKGMPAWESILDSNQGKAVTVFVVSLKGSKPAVPKTAQGDKASQ